MVKHCDDGAEAPLIEEWSLKIKTLRGADAAINVNPTTSVLAVKERLCAIKSITIEQQRLIYRGRVLPDDSTMSDCHVKNGDTIHLVIRQVPPPGIDPIPQNQPQQPPNSRESVDMSDLEQELDGLHNGEGVSNLLNQLFEEMGSHSSQPAANRFLIDSLRRNLNLWDREMRHTQPPQPVNNNPSTSTPNQNPDSQPFPPLLHPEAWNQNATDLRRAFQACQSQVSSNLPQLYTRANQLVAEDRPENPDQFQQDMRNVAINFRRLGKIFSLLGHLCRSVNASGGNIEVTSRRPRRHINFNGMVVTQTHVNLNPNAIRRPRRGVVNGMNDRNNRPNQPARPPSANNRPRPNRSNPPNFNSIMANIMRQQQRNNPQRRNSQNSSSDGRPNLRRPNNPNQPNAAPNQNQQLPLFSPISMFLTATRRVQVPTGPNRNDDNQSNPPPQAPNSSVNPSPQPNSNSNSNQSNNTS